MRGFFLISAVFFMFLFEKTAHPDFNFKAECKRSHVDANMHELKFIDSSESKTVYYLYFVPDDKKDCDNKSANLAPNGFPVTHCSCNPVMASWDLSCFKLSKDGNVETLANAKWHGSEDKCREQIKLVEEQQIYPPKTQSWGEWFKEKWDSIFGSSSSGKTGQTDPQSKAESGNMIKPVESIQTGGGGTTTGGGGTAGGGR